VAGWADLELRARLILVRAAVRAGRFEEARAELPGLRRDLVAAEVVNELRVAVCDYLMGFVCIKAGEYDEAEALLELSLAAFRQIGVTRWAAWALSLLGVFHTDLHDFEAAERSLAEAESMAAEMGCVAGMLTCRGNLARARIAGGRIDEAIESLRDSLTWVTSEAQVVPAMNARLLLAFALGYQGHKEEARRVAGELVAMACEIRNREFELHGQILAAWVNGHTDGLRSLVALGLHSDHERTAWLYLADLAGRTDEAAAMLERATSIERENGGNPWDRLADRVRSRIHSCPIQYETNRLVIDLGRGLPNFNEAMGAVRRFLVTAALDRADGNQTQAAALVGLTRSVFHDHVCRAEGRPTRPPRTSPADPSTTE
jgi:tetratricopeptide (TPR) repeat protein